MALLITQHVFTAEAPRNPIRLEAVNTTHTRRSLLLLAATTTSLAVLCSTKLILHLLQLLIRTAVECCVDEDV